MQFRDGVSRLSLRHLQVLESLHIAAREVQERRVVSRHSRHDLEIADAPNKRIGKRLKHEDRQRLLVGHFALNRVALPAWLAVTADAPASRRIGEHFDDHVQDRIAADIVERRTDHHRNDAPRLNGQPQAPS